MVRISTFIVGILIVGLGASIFGLFLGGLDANYGISENTNLTSFNKLTQLTSDAYAIKNETMNIETKSGIFDIIGDYISGGYKTLKLAVKSFDAFEDMTLEGANEMNLGSSGQVIRTTIIAIVVIMIFIGVIVSALLNKDV